MSEFFQNCLNSPLLQISTTTTAADGALLASFTEEKIDKPDFTIHSSFSST